MKVKLYNQLGEETGSVELLDAIFNIPLNHDLVHQAIVTQMANSREILAHAKGRGEVRGGGKKPWRQKGTGRARHGSIRSPIWKGGGVTHGPLKEKIYSKKINKKAKQKALFMALSSKAKDNQLLVVDLISLSEVKTKKMKEIFDKISANLAGYKKAKKKQDSILLVQPGSNKDLVRAVRNLPFLETVRADSVNVIGILENKYLILLKDSIPVIEKTYLK
ncbi:MAG: 50S ribosomal protein L4 [Parcubacteria group bacterium RIFCSPLOWO2_01_FULL_40_65]|nr:ribosomal protein L4 [uncultured bacterium]OHB17699.1 MAG: 50S ribosomal protein L4 [Parcubacteria group bacterium RIFCSPHIGHO2_01_FULL_40_30]OHB19876.1 MAG: 50S ribosomal protein L4 [Parcubacteria group bacterium RIFCSPHIGHO2_02_FULL_40_12]OHB21587.1 MAG: 50S ribosomal protein L4 [Parcubacteria group bacterium RIFCSPLOWO2_01_FULL_40_65]OHB23488.1 MAG: 50S ribosomal protein L4 [Parcubacteria group bacterium RIFCSPLOWO2_02_FULL_40_12]OHB24038.1 MAG: 50S ribosomal protein L4 [Parcubacteria gr